MPRAWPSHARPQYRIEFADFVVRVSSPVMRQSIRWQPLLLFASLLLAVSLAVGGWALGRWRSHEHAATEKPTPPRSTVPIEADTIKVVAVPDARGLIQLDPASAALI